MTTQELTEIKAGKMPRHKGPKRTGTVYLDKSFKYYRRGAGYCQRNEWRGEISVHGKRFRCRAGSYVRCLAWCSDMVKKYGEY